MAADAVALFRIGFGIVAMLGSLRFLARGWVDSLYLAPEHHLTYPGFGWVQPLPAPWMHVHMVALAALGACIALGYRHRPAAVLFTAGFAYTELIDAALYLNHYWFVTLAGLLMVLLPVHHRWSLDARAGRVAPSGFVPAAVLWALRSQVAVVYVFAGLAKLNGDWLLRAQPLRLWLADRAHLPVIGELLDKPLVAYAASWAGTLFDCTIVGWLLWRRSRPWAYGALVGFHLVTGALFQIGVFPWLMIVAATVFFDPDWPARLARTVRARDRIGGSAPTQGIAATHAASSGTAARISRPAAAALVVLAVVQLLLPLRHYAYQTNVRWSEESYYLSWRVMITEKAGHVDYRITDPSTGRTWTAGPELVLADWQAEHADTRPGLIHVTALLIAQHYREAGLPDVEVRADAWVAMNGGPAHRIIDPAVDLAAQARTPAPDRWILPAP
ncbi:MAG: HTTM domain-containing protein [Acidimicrobiaceae bacterium]|nr:HTTM domain-containing protein [Acidimicrobiaceae bacterium]